MSHWVKYILFGVIILFSGCIPTRQNIKTAITTPEVIPIKPFKPIPEGYADGKAIVGPCYSMQEAMREGINEAISNLVKSSIPSEVTIQSMNLSQFETGYGGTRRYSTRITIGEKKAKILKFDLYQCELLQLLGNQYGVQIMVICKKEDIEFIKEESSDDTKPEIADPYSLSLKLLNEIKNWIGNPYHLGGDSPSGIDCSHFVYRVYSSSGIDIPYPGTYNQIKTFISKGKYIRYHNDRTFGDLIYFGHLINKSEFESKHVAIYLSGGYIAHACKGKGVVVEGYPDYLKTIGGDSICKPLFIARPCKAFESLSEPEIEKIKQFIKNNLLTPDINRKPHKIIALVQMGRKRYLTLKDIERLSPKELRLLRNTFYAFYNRPFQDKNLETFFKEYLSGYEPDPNMWKPRLSPIEEANVKFILNFEMRRDYVK